MRFFYDQIRNDLISILTKAQTVIYQQNIVCIIELPPDGKLPEAIIGRLTSCLEKHNLYGGFGNPFADIASLRTYYLQALAAIKLAQQKKSRPVTSYYGDHILDALITHYTETQDPVNLVHPAVPLLEKYDADAGTAYLHTLRVYIHCLGNMAKAAAELGIHYNTMKYRIKMIESIANISLKETTTFINLFISFQHKDQG